MAEKEVAAVEWIDGKFVGVVDISPSGRKNILVLRVCVDASIDSCPIT